MVGPRRHRTCLISAARPFFGLAQFGAAGFKNLGSRRTATLDPAYRYALCDWGLPETVAVIAANQPNRATPVVSVPLQASGIGPIFSRCCRFGGATDLSRSRSGGPNKVRAEAAFDRVATLGKTPSPEDTVRAIRSVVAHELACMHAVRQRFVRTG